MQRCSVTLWLWTQRSVKIGKCPKPWARGWLLSFLPQPVHACACISQGNKKWGLDRCYLCCPRGAFPTLAEDTIALLLLKRRAGGTAPVPKRLCFGVQMERQRDADAGHWGSARRPRGGGGGGTSAVNPLVHSTAKEASKGLHSSRRFPRVRHGDLNQKCATSPCSCIASALSSLRATGVCMTPCLILIHAASVWHLRCHLQRSFN